MKALQRVYSTGMIQSVPSRRRKRQPFPETECPSLGRLETPPSSSGTHRSSFMSSLKALLGNRTSQVMLMEPDSTIFNSSGSEFDEKRSRESRLDNPHGITRPLKTFDKNNASVRTGVVNLDEMGAVDVDEASADENDDEDSSCSDLSMKDPLVIRVNCHPSEMTNMNVVESETQEEDSSPESSRFIPPEFVVVADKNCFPVEI